MHELWNRAQLQVTAQLVASAACAGLSAIVATLWGDYIWLKPSLSVKVRV